MYHDMNTTTVKLYNLPLLSTRTAMYVLVFTLSNVLFPQLVHLVPNGGFIFLPIYFFTIIGAYKYGLAVGLLTAVLSPAVNHLLFGMPASGVLAVIMIKGVLAAVAAAYMARKTSQVSILSLVAVVAFYQLVGGVAEWAMTSSLAAALQDVRMGLAGMVLQVVGGYVVLRYVARK
jgi:hypothetical protein